MLVKLQQRHVLTSQRKLRKGQSTRFVSFDETKDSTLYIVKLLVQRDL